MDSAAIAAGAALGHLAGRVEAWKAQGDVIAADVKRFVAHAHGLLDDLGHSADTEASVLIASAKNGAARVARSGAKGSRQVQADLRAMADKVKRAGGSTHRKT